MKNSNYYIKECCVMTMQLVVDILTLLLVQILQTAPLGSTIHTLLPNYFIF